MAVWQAAVRVRGNCVECPVLAMPPWCVWQAGSGACQRQHARWFCASRMSWAHPGRRALLHARHAHSLCPLCRGGAGALHARAAQCTASGFLCTHVGCKARLHLATGHSASCHRRRLSKPCRAHAGWVFSDNAVVVTTLAQILVFVAVAIVGDGVNAVQVRSQAGGQPCLANA